MTSVARLDVENLPGRGRSCQPVTTGRPRHDWSMRLLGLSASQDNGVGRVVALQVVLDRDGAAILWGACCG